MFNKKKQGQHYLSSVDDTMYVVNDFCLRGSRDYGYESYRNLEYRLYHKLEENEMLPILDEHLDKLFSGDVDEANGDMLTGTIFGAAREAAPDLRRQRYNHLDLLRRLTVRRKVDPKDVERLKAESEKELTRLQADYEKVCELLEKCKEF